MAFATIDSPASAVLSFAGGGSAVNVDFDLTFILQMLLFMVLVVALKPLLFDPILRVFEERERRTDGARDEAREMQREAGELLVKYEAELRRISQAAAEERDRIRTDTSRLEAQILSEAREASTHLIEHGRRQIGDQVDKIRFELGKRSADLARDIATQVLGREIR